MACRLLRTLDNGVARPAPSLVFRLCLQQERRQMPAVRVEPIVALTHEGGGARRKRDSGARRSTSS